MRDNMRMRRLVKSEWYQRLWPLGLAADQDAKLKFENAATGFRAAVAATAMTGHRGDRVLYDDPHSVEGALSRPAAQHRAAGVLGDGHHPAQLAGALGDRRGDAAAARAGPLGHHPRARARLRAPVPADGVRGRPPLRHLDRLPRSAQRGRRAACSPRASRPRWWRATSGRWASSAPPGSSSSARPRAAAACSRPTASCSSIIRPSLRRSPTRSATGTRPAPRTAAPTPPACCCTS